MLVVRILALLGFGISAYLYAMKLTGKISSVVGCGGEGGCADVLGSVWSQWFGLPVSAISALFYIGIVGLTFKPSPKLLTLAAYLLIGAALWFMGLQLFVIKSFCPWCFTTHLVGVVTALAILRTQEKKFPPTALAFAATMIAALALGQIFGPKPDTHEMTSEDDIEERKLVKAQTAGEGRLITFTRPDGAVFKSFRLGSVPLLGSPDATHVLVKYFDYTCKSCRDMEGDLAALMEAHPKEVAVVVLPTPLNRACNPHLKPNIRDHQDACELARLGLAAWKAQPETFSKAHTILFERPIHDPASAREELLTIISAEKLDAALKDPWVEKSLQANILDYQALSRNNIYMPKLMLTGTTVWHGLLKSTEFFIEEVEKKLKIQ